MAIPKAGHLLQKWQYPRLGVCHRNGHTQDWVSITEMAIFRAEHLPQKWPYLRLGIHHRNGHTQRVNQLQKRPHKRSHICYRNGYSEAYWELTSICQSNRKCQSNIATPVVTASIISLQKAPDSLKYWHQSWFQTNSKTMTVPVCKMPVKMQSDTFFVLQM